MEKKTELRLETWTMLKVKAHEKESEKACAGTVWKAGGGAGESCGLRQTKWSSDSCFKLCNNWHERSMRKDSLLIFCTGALNAPRNLTNKGKTQKKSLQSDLNTPSKIVHKLCTVCAQGWVMTRRNC